MQQEKSAILGFSYGYKINYTPAPKHQYIPVRMPGASNEDLVKALFIRYPALWKGDSILQGELADAAESFRIYFRQPKPRIVLEIRKHQQDERYLDSDEVARQGVAYAAQQGYTMLYVLAVPTFPLIHRWYCVRAVRKLASPHGIKVISLKTGWISCDPLSEQWWTRNPWANFYYTARGLLFPSRRGR